MAGYRAPGARFTNATTTNNQIEDQRTAYQSRGENSGSDRGVARSTTPLFRMPDDIFEASVGIFSLLDLAVGSGNPDFGPSNTMSNIPGTSEMFDNVSAQVDKPNKKGPNLIAPDINGETFSNDEQQTSQFTNRGFGWRDQRNEPATSASRIGEYFSKHYDATGPSQDSPVFGEAKSPDPDPKIDYDQP
jgi:hypothetical protein